jgi:hypothetical protein
VRHAAILPAARDAGPWLNSAISNDVPAEYQIDGAVRASEWNSLPNSLTSDPYWNGARARSCRPISGLVRPLADRGEQRRTPATTLRGMGFASPLIALGLAIVQIALGLSIPSIALGSLWLGVELGAGVHRSRFVQVLRVCLPFLVLVVLWQLARFASNTNDQGGDMTDQIVTQLLAVVYVVVYGLAALGGRIYRVAVGG